MVKNITKSIQKKKRQECSLLLRSKVPPLKIQKRLKISMKTINRVKNSLAKKRSVKKKKRSKGNSKLLKTHKLAINQLIKKNPFLSCVDIKNRLSLPVTPECVRLYLLGAGFTRKKLYPQFALNSDHIQARFIGAQKMKDFIFAPEIVFTDTSSIWLFDNNHQGWFHSNENNSLSVDKHSGKIHIWGAISMLYGKIAMCTFRSNLDSKLLLDILKEDLLPAAGYCYPEGWFLQMDNDSKNTSILIQNFVYNYVPNFIDWPSRAPDLNPIENVWKLLKQKVRKRLPSTLDELENVIHEEWANLHDDTIIEICESFPDRIEQCLEKQGGRLNY